MSEEKTLCIVDFKELGQGDAKAELSNMLYDSYGTGTYSFDVVDVLDYLDRLGVTGVHGTFVTDATKTSKEDVVQLLIDETQKIVKQVEDVEFKGIETNILIWLHSNERLSMADLNEYMDGVLDPACPHMFVDSLDVEMKKVENETDVTWAVSVWGVPVQ